MCTVSTTNALIGHHPDANRHCLLRTRVMVLGDMPYRTLLLETDPGMAEVPQPGTAGDAWVVRAWAEVKWHGQAE
jgi:hypothetical protein